MIANLSRGSSRFYSRIVSKVKTQELSQQEQIDSASTRKSPEDSDNIFGKLREKQRQSFCPDGFLRRADVCARAKITTKEFDSLEKRKLVSKAKKNARGFALYDLEILEQITRLKKKGMVSRDPKRKLSAAVVNKVMTYSNMEATQVLVMIRDGISPTDIVLRTGLHPAVVQTIRRDAAALEGGLYIPKDVMDLINKLPLDGTFPVTSSRQIIDMLMSAVKVLECSRCGKRPRSKICKDCLLEASEQRFNVGSVETKPEADSSVGVTDPPMG